MRDLRGAIGWVLTTAVITYALTVAAIGVIAGG
jgi:hypothetical protein